MRDMMSVLLEGVLDEEFDEELGYSKYDYRNKDTDNSRNGHSKKTMHTSAAILSISSTLKVKSKTLKFSCMRSLCVDFGMTTTPRCR